MSTYSNPLTEYSPQMESLDVSSRLESDVPSRRGIFDEYQEMDLAAGLLEVTDEQELDQFIAAVVRKAGTLMGKAVSSQVGQSIGGVLKTAASKALPFAGGALGGIVGGPLGARLGSGFASIAGQTLGLELEGLSPEDREFQASKQFVVFAGEVVRNALKAPPGTDPSGVAHAAAAEAARVHAPGLDPDRPAVNQSANSKVRRRRMHDIDRTQVGYSQELEPESYEGENYEGENYEESYEYPEEASPLNETEEMELVSELMELETEEEFENFLSGLVSKVIKKAGGFIDSPTGQALGGLLKGAAKKLLPMAGKALGGFAGGPAGTLVGGRLGSDVEAEADELEWEAANTFVKLATDASKNVAQAPPGASPEAVATRAVTNAAQVHAPGLLVPQGGGPIAPPPAARYPFPRGLRSGRWVRRGNQIILFGV